MSDRLSSAPLPRRPRALPAWVPVHMLGEQHREGMLQHLLALSPRDRYLRFGYEAQDAQISRYVQGLDLQRDRVYGIVDRQLALVALAHLAFSAEGEGLQRGPSMAEFGVSVSAPARGRGHGAQLFEQAMLLARQYGIDTLYIHALSENTAMLHIARKAGGQVRRSGTESDARVHLPPRTWASRLELWTGCAAARVDYGLKRQARQWALRLGQWRQRATAG